MEYRKHTAISGAGTTSEPTASILIGIFVSSVGTVGSIKVTDSSDVTIIDTFLPSSVGFYPFPMKLDNGCKIVVGGIGLKCTLLWGD